MRHKKLSKFRKRFRGIGLEISLALSLIIGAAHLISQPEFNFVRSTGLLEIIEAKTLDLRFHLRGARSPGSDIVIVAMDEKTEDELGRWQTAGRRWIAQMVAKLSEEGAAVIGFDVALAEPDENTALQAIDALKRRCLYQWMGYPERDRELQIVAARAPEAAAALQRQAVDFIL